jgi:hypothetical protein
MAGTPFGTQEQNPCRMLMLHKPEGTRWVGRPVRWLGSVEEDLKTMGIRNWRQVTGSGPMESNHKRWQGLSWTVAPIEEEEEGSYYWTSLRSVSMSTSTSFFTSIFKLYTGNVICVIYNVRYLFKCKTVMRVLKIENDVQSWITQDSFICITKYVPLRMTL